MIPCVHSKAYIYFPLAVDPGHISSDYLAWKIHNYFDLGTRSTAVRKRPKKVPPPVLGLEQLLLLHSRVLYQTTTRLAREGRVSVCVGNTMPLLSTNEGWLAPPHWDQAGRKDLLQKSPASGRVPVSCLMSQSNMVKACERAQEDNNARTLTAEN